MSRGSQRRLVLARRSRCQYFRASNPRQPVRGEPDFEPAKENEVRKDITVTAEVRTSRGKNEARRTRRAGQIPAVVYGAYKDPVSVAVNPREILKIVRSNTGYNTIFNLAIAGRRNHAR